ncbi:MAG TPA: pyridoxal-phosphate dependent enzyme, partial [Nakamurella sp.]
AQLGELESEVDTVVGCVGAGSNFGGVALPFFARHRAGESEHLPLLLAAESSATPKLSRGVYAYDVTDATGTGPMEAMYTIGAGYRIPASHSAGLRFHGAAKLLSAMRHRGQISAVGIGQRDAMDAARRFALTEQVLPAPESGHALAAAASVACGQSGRLGGAAGGMRGVLVCVSGHGLLDLSAYDDLLAGAIEDSPAGADALRAATSALRSVTSDQTDLIEVS